MENKKTALIGTIITIAVVIIIAGSFIIFKNPAEAPESQTAQLNPGEETTNPEPIIHVLGNPNAELSFAVYFDVNCGYCRAFHLIMKQIIEEYGKQGKLSWVSKHFPLNPISQKEAEAAECVGELGGEEKYWSYMDSLMEGAVDPNSTELATELADLAVNNNIDKAEFEQCLEEGGYASKIAKDQEEGLSLGIRGTPTWVITKNGKQIEIIPGALSYEDMKEKIESLLSSS